MKLKIFSITLILLLSLNVISVSAVNYTTYYSETEWYKALVDLLSEYPSLLDQNYIDEVRSKGEYPVGTITDTSENGETVYNIPYMCYFNNPGNEYNNVLEIYILYAPAYGEKFSFMVYKFNEASGKYEYTERTPLTNMSLNGDISWSEFGFYNEGYSLQSGDDEFFEKARDLYNSRNTTEVPLSSPKIRIGDKVMVRQGAGDYNGTKLASFVYSNVYEVVQVTRGNRVVIGRRNAVTNKVEITAAVSVRDLLKV